MGWESGWQKEPASGPGGPDPAVCSVGLGEAVTFPGPASDWPEAPCCRGWSRPHGALEARCRSTRGHRAGEDAGRGEGGQGPVPSPTATVAGIHRAGPRAAARTGFSSFILYAL